MAMPAMDVGDDYLHLPRDDNHDEYASETLFSVDALLSLHPRPPGAAAYAAGIIPRVCVAGAPRGSELAAASVAMDVGVDYLHLPQDDDHDEYTSEALSSADALLSLHPRSPGTAAYAAGIIPRVRVAVGPRDSELAAAAVVKALATVDGLSDGRGCPICMDDDQVAWKETSCGHRFHRRCVETWLKSKGSCPMCRRQVVTMPTPRNSWTNLWSGRRLPSS